MERRTKLRRREAEIAGLRSKLRELQDTLNAIRSGEVDALLVEGPGGQQVFSLRGAEQPYRVFVEQMREGAVTVGSDGAVLYANRRFAELVGVPLEQIITTDFAGYMTEESRGFMREIEREKSGEGSDIELLGPGGRRIPVRLSFNRMPMAEGEAICLVIMDLTEQRERKLLDETLAQLRESQEALRRQYASLERAAAAIEQANAAKDQFLAALSHELRTPLNPVLMTVTALAVDPKIPKQIREDLRMVRRNIELEARLIDDLLDITRITQNKLTVDLQPVEIHGVLSEVIEICRSEGTNKGLTFKTSFGARPSHVGADHVRLQQILWNILRNAVKFTPNGGRITIATRNRGDMVEVSITDTGIGIPPEMLSRIFNAFQQGGAHITRQFGGLGLGLAISHKLALLHHGMLVADSKGAGKGSTFTLTLPAATPPKTRRTGPKEPAVHCKPLRILLVEDHEDTRRNMARLLSAMKHTVLVAGSAEEALHLAGSSEVDLVISDLGLPDRSGLDLMRDLQRNHGLVGICLSGYGMENDIANSREAGFARHLTKPIDLNRLERVIGEMAQELRSA